MWPTLVKKFFLKKFRTIPLSNAEMVITNEAIGQKYVPAIVEAVVISIFTIPPAIFLDTIVLATVLIPITMVAGTAWFAISLATLKLKFNTFGLELTKNMFSGFLSSMGMLGVIAAASLLKSAGFGSNMDPSRLTVVLSALVGIAIVGRVLWNLLAASLKYDLNDSMLLGQHEAAERFYRRALSMLRSTAETLQTGKNLHVANYQLGWAFMDLFENVRRVNPHTPVLTSAFETAEKLRMHPQMSQEEADKLAVGLVDQFLNQIQLSTPTVQQKVDSIRVECKRIMERESQELVDSRFAVIFNIITDMLLAEGDELFRKND